VPNSVKRFGSNVAQDGEYWYGVVPVDKDGKMFPADLKELAPAQRVMVDTTPAVIQAAAVKGPDGAWCLRVTIEDANPDRSSLKVVCKTDKGEVPFEAVPNQPGLFRIKGSEPTKFLVIATAMDMAKNLSWQEVNVRELIDKAMKSAKAPPAAGGTAEMTKQELDDLTVQAFGSDCAELRLPVRVWLPALGAIVAAKKADVVEGPHAVRFTSASIGFPRNTTESEVLRGDEIVIVVTTPVESLGFLKDRVVAAVAGEGEAGRQINHGGARAGARESSSQLLVVPRAGEHRECAGRRLEGRGAVAGRTVAETGGRGL
jgi:hypothetical protein